MLQRLSNYLLSAFPGIVKNKVFSLVAILIAVAIQTVRAANTNPAQSLKYE